MKRYNLEKEKLRFKWGEAYGYSLGEEGRGRLLRFVIDKSATEYVAPIRTKNGGYMIVNSEYSPFWLARLNTNGGYQRGVSGYAKARDIDNVKVFACGYGAWGDAGRLGTYDELIAIIPDNTWIMMRMSGHADNYFLFFGAGRVHKVKTEEVGAFCDMMNIEAPDKENMKQIGNENFKTEEEN